MHLGVECITLMHNTRGRNRKTHRAEIVQRSVFPGYVFARDVNDQQRREICNHVAYFICFLRFGPEEALVADDELQAIRRILQAEIPIVARLQLIPGQRVRIRRGCMAGLMGEYVSDGNGWGDELIINMPLFGRSVAMPITADMVDVL
jgi:transcription antitermination factor NusG